MKLNFCVYVREEKKRALLHTSSWRWRCRPARPSSRGRPAACAWGSWWFCLCKGVGSPAGSRPEPPCKRPKASGGRPRSRSARWSLHPGTFPLESPGKREREKLDARDMKFLPWFHWCKWQQIHIWNIFLSPVQWTSQKSILVFWTSNHNQICEVFTTTKSIQLTWKTCMVCCWTDSTARMFL